MTGNANLINMLTRHEGASNHLYTCPGGRLTIGVGHNIEDNGLSDHIIRLILQEDIDNALKDLCSIFPTLYTMGVARRDALTDMMFNLGLPAFRSFKRMIAAIERERWEQAATEALDSAWATQVGERAQEIAQLLRTDSYTEAE